MGSFALVFIVLSLTGSETDKQKITHEINFLRARALNHVCKCRHDKPLTRQLRFIHTSRNPIPYGGNNMFCPAKCR